ncbi:MAG TPA: ankyrin repeat domain-containing protein [Bryobacteraceae bacterium]
MRQTIKRLLICLLPLPLTGLAAVAGLRLVQAAKNQDRDAVRALLQQNVDVNTAYGDGTTALHWAAYFDDAGIADLLIRGGADVNKVNDLGVTALALTTSSAMAEQLLKAGANPNIVSSTGESPLMSAARTGDVEMVKALLGHGANPNAKENVRGQTALMWAAAQNHPDVVRVLLEHRADVHARTLTDSQLFYTGEASGAGRNASDWVMRTIDTGGSTPLMFAARQGDLASARLLLAAGANPNETRADGMSPLVLASFSGHGDFAAFLLSKDASPNAADVGYAALHTAVLRGDVELVKTLLMYGANPNARITKGSPITREGEDWILPTPLVGATPFFLAAKFLEIDVMRALAKAGADPLLGTADGTTPLMAASGVGWGGGVDRRGRDTSGNEATINDSDRALEAAKLVLDLGASINAANEAGDTALHGAAAKGYDAIVQELADRGARLDIKNKRGRTPLGVAKKSSADLLRKLGAKE